MHGRNSSPVVPLKTWPGKTSRSAVLQGIAVVVLLVFITLLLRGNWLIAGLCVSGTIGGWWLIELSRKSRERLFTLQELDTMREEEFRTYIIELLRVQGFGVRKVGGWREQRSDMVLSWREEPVLCRVSCSSHTIRRREIAELHMVAKARGMRRLLFVTSQNFSPPARLLARNVNCLLIDREQLGHLVTQQRQGHRVYHLHREETTKLRKRH